MNEPSYPLFDETKLQPLEQYLKEKSFLDAGEEIQELSKAGQGNMNVVLRVQTNQRCFIVKQSRPWVAKYPNIPAPDERIIVEETFYQAISEDLRLTEQTPKIYFGDPPNRLLIMTDLGKAGDFTFIYQQDTPSVEVEFSSLIVWLKQVHQTRVKNVHRPILENMDMKRLNHFHQYEFPLQENNGLDLDSITPGLQEAANELKQNLDYVTQVKALGQRYLIGGSYLLHGDFFPGSFIQTAFKPVVIDPEFCHLGEREYDLGVLNAHLLMSGFPSTILEWICGEYNDSTLDNSLLMKYCGAEIMRRLIGVAQLPLKIKLGKKRALLRLSEKWILS